MFDRTSIVNGLCRQWIQQGRLSERAWLQVQEQHRTTKANLEELLLASSHIDEDTLLEGLAAAIGCRYWRGNALVDQLRRKPPPALPAALDFFAHKQILPLSWDAPHKILHLIMAQLPTGSLLQELQTLVPIAKLHLELAPKAAIQEQLQRWLKQSSKITSMLDATTPVSPSSLLEEGLSSGSTEQTQQLGSLRPPQSQTDPATAETQNAAAFQAEPEVLSTAALGRLPTGPGREAIDKTYAILPVAPTLAKTPGASKKPMAQTIEAAPPAAFPSQPQAPHASSPMTQPAASRLPSGDLTYAEADASNGALAHQDSNATHAFAVDDGDFFLDYQSPPTPPPTAYVPLDDDGEPALPTAQGNDSPIEKTERFAPAPAPPPVLELSDVLDEVPPARPAAQTTPAPRSAAPRTTSQPAPKPKPAMQPGSPILPSDDELFGHSLRAPSIAQPPPQISRPSHIKPAPPTSTSRVASKARPKQRKLKNGFLEDFLLRYLLGGAVGVVNLVIRFGFIAAIGYLVWYLFLSQ